MKNVDQSRLKTCIFLTGDEYADVLRKIFGDGLEVEYGLEGITMTWDDESQDPDGEPEAREITNVEAKLAEYFGVSVVTSVHIDDCDTVGVWICYKNAQE